MNFSLEYTKEQEEFAKEVREWLHKNIPKDLVYIRDPIKLTYEQWQKRRELGRKLAEKGWLWAGWPREYGGGGLDVDHCFVLYEELIKEHFSLPPFYDSANLAVPAILACGTEEQKRRFLPPIFRGEAIVWQLFTEPEAGTDEANQQTNALRSVREGDYFIVNGGKIFVGGIYAPPDQLLLLTRSDLQAPRHQNLAMFFAPANLPGISIIPLDLFPSAPPGHVLGLSVDNGCGLKHQVFFDDVRIHESCLIGGDRDGWRVAIATLTVEHGDKKSGGAGVRIMRNLVVEKLLDQCKNNPNVVERLRENPQLLESVVDVYISAQIDRLFATRNAAGRGGAYGGPQQILHQKLFGTRLIAEIAKILGPTAFIDDAEWGLDESIFEIIERSGIAVAPGGTPEALKITISRALRIGR